MAEHFHHAGAMRYRLHCQKGASQGDGWGNTLPGAGSFNTQFTVFAAMRPRTGGEEVTAARLGGRQPYVVTIYNSPQTRQITTAWRLVDARDENRVFAIVSPPADPDGKNQWLEFLAVEGAVG